MLNKLSSFLALVTDALHVGNTYYGLVVQHTAYGTGTFYEYK
jgi:hypothetical protein